MKHYKCIIFDCDGVLVDSEVLGNQVMVDLANEYGANINLSFALENFKGGFLKDCIQQIESIVGKVLPKDFEREYRKRSFEIFKNNLQPVTGVEDVLKELNISFCVASSGPQEKIRLNLKTTGLLSYFNENIFSCYDIEKWKPDPAVFLHAATTMGYTPKECLVIEDTPIGVEAAKSGGFDVFGYSPNGIQENFQDNVDKIFYSMDVLLPMISGNR
ncbi:HAD family hydrolase [Maribacter algarum]|uniref:HAD family hydrolase n=1 Tax=Maribacter algarum (ex Zhang et al. 2020) TaxID=2578118 RepID=A0A5S3PPE7_9FLAO|nr:HAD family hydrolase [Maribacter algarum]TMM56293.1 HAD family hydrolase [Maribacter algarum]